MLPGVGRSVRVLHAILIANHAHSIGNVAQVPDDFFVKTGPGNPEQLPVARALSRCSQGDGVKGGGPKDLQPP